MILPRIGAVLLALLAAGLLLLVRLDTTWGHRPFDVTEAALTGVALVMLVAAALAWNRPAVGWSGLGLFAIVALLIAIRGANILNWFQSSPEPGTAEIVMPTE